MNYEHFGISRGWSIGVRIHRCVQPLCDVHTYPWFKERVRKVEDDPFYDPSDWQGAMQKALLCGDEIPIGKFFQRRDLPSLDQA
jgi:hypothetical protein